VLSGGEMNHRIAPRQQAIDQREILQLTHFDADSRGTQLLHALRFDMKLGTAGRQHIDAELMGT
jgi:hypothetical protein